MICCKLHPDAGTIIRLVGPHIGVYCKQCNKWLKWINIKEIDDCFNPTLDIEPNVENTSSHIACANKETKLFESSADDDDVPW